MSLNAPQTAAEIKDQMLLEETINTDKQDFVQIAATIFAQHEGLFPSGDTLLNQIKGAYRNAGVAQSILDQIRVCSDEEHYGTFKFIYTPLATPDNPYPQETHFRFKQPNAYDGPKTENFIEKAESLTRAARAIILESNLSETAKNTKLAQLNMLRDDYLEQLMALGFINHQDIQKSGGLRKDNQKLQQDYKVIFSAGRIGLDNYLNAIIDLNADILANNLDSTPHGSDSDKRKKLGEVLYAKEVEQHCKQVPEMVTTRLQFLKNNLPKTKRKQKADQGCPEKATYAVTTITQPTNPEKTITSAKKNDHGISNWYTSTNVIMDDSAKILSVRSNERSASIVPHEILKAQPELANEITEYNVLNEIIPRLLEAKLKENPALNPQEIISLDYVLQTLLSPLSETLDTNPYKDLDPDLLQVKAMRDALNKYKDRPLKVKAANGQEYTVQMNAIYLNSPVNIVRGALKPRMERRINAKGITDLTDRSFVKLNAMAAQANDPEVNKTIEIMQECLRPNKDKEMFARLETENNHIAMILADIYSAMDKHQLSASEHQTWMKLQQKQEKGNLTHSEAQTLHKLNLKRERMQAFAKQQPNMHIYEYLGICKLNGVSATQPITNDNMVKQLEKIRYENYIKIHKARSKAMVKNQKKLEAAIANIPDDHQEVKDLAVAMTEYYQAQRVALKGSRRRLLKIVLDSKNKRNFNALSTNRNNYAQPKYARVLAEAIGATYQKTCKSGKDRTNSDEEMYNAAELMRVHTGQLQKARESDDLYLAQIDVYERAFQAGNGNYICANCMEVGMQTIDKYDIPSHMDPNVMRDMARLQKAGSIPLSESSKNNHIKKGSSRISSTSSDYSESESETYSPIAEDIENYLRSLNKMYIRLNRSDIASEDKTLKTKHLERLIEECDQLLKQSLRSNYMYEHGFASQGYALNQQLEERFYRVKPVIDAFMANEKILDIQTQPTRPRQSMRKTMFASHRNSSSARELGEDHSRQREVSREMRASAFSQLRDEQKIADQIIDESQEKPKKLHQRIRSGLKKLKS